jgi:8-oxo-dGTP pyrophosphatase MutT (NUDIX family)
MPNHAQMAHAHSEKPKAMKSFSSFIQKLKGSLSRGLPGEASHASMEALSAAYLSLKPDQHTRRSAVLMLLYPFKNQVYFPLILRPAYNGFHSGEVGFPGGRYELTDKDLIHTALREANEEIGLKLQDDKILGTLTEIYIGPSNFLVLPVLGYIPSKPDFIPDDREVASILEVRLDQFREPHHIGTSQIPIPGEMVTTPHYIVDGHKVWGATAKIISELLAIVGESPTRINNV